LKVDTIVVGPSGAFIMGDRTHPIAEDVSAKVIFTDSGPIDRNWDPFAFSRGLISHGQVKIHGFPHTHYATMSIPQVWNTNTLTLNGPVPADWRVGDRIAGTSSYPTNRDQRRTILGIEGNQLVLDPFADSHQFAGAASLPSAGGAFRQPAYDMYVADMIRNATFESENGTVRMRRGHVMFMHSQNVEIENAGFYNLGRTDKQNVASDPTT